MTLGQFCTLAIFSMMSTLHFAAVGCARPEHLFHFDLHFPQRRHVNIWFPNTGSDFSYDFILSWQSFQFDNIFHIGFVINMKTQFCVTLLFMNHVAMDNWHGEDISYIASLYISDRKDLWVVINQDHAFPLTVTKVMFHVNTRNCTPVGDPRWDQPCWPLTTLR